MSRQLARPSRAAVKLGIFTVCLAARHRPAGRDHGQHRLRRRRGVQGGLQQRLDARRRATTSGSPASTSARSSEVEHYERTSALVTFRVKDEIDLTTRVARRDPLPQPGRRPLPGPRARARTRRPSRSSPATPSRSSSTSPALDLTVLFNGFQPLFQALRPRAGQRARASTWCRCCRARAAPSPACCEKTASLTNTLADRDQLIGEVITNLSPDPRHRRPAPRAARPADRRAQGLDDRPGPRPATDRRLARQHLRR